MKVQINAGVFVDIPTAQENADAVTRAQTGWRQEIARGVEFRDIAGQGTVAGGAFTIGGTSAVANNINSLAPRPGFVWAVMRLAVSGNGFVPGADTFAVYKGDVSAMRLVSSGHTRFVLYEKGQLIVDNAQALVVTGVGTGPGGTDVFVSGQAIEVPDQLRWMLV